MEFFEIFRKELVVFGLSLLPISEIRGALIYGIPAMGDNIFAQLQAYFISVIGNMLPVPFIMWLFRPILKSLKKTRLFKKPTMWLEKRTKSKAKRLAKISAGALFLFVAVPLPTTGAWTGAMIASLLDIRYKFALPAILAGIMVAGLIITLIMNGVLSFGFLDAIFLN